MVGEAPAYRGTFSHKNTSFFGWQEWEDIVGGYFPNIHRSSYEANKVDSVPILTGIVESRWVNPDSPGDCRVYLRTRAAPGTTIQVQWNVKCSVLVPRNVQRERCEIEVFTGTPFTGIDVASWVTDEARDARLLVKSHAQGPMRWFKARWRIYSGEARSRKVIDELPGTPLARTAPSS